MSRATLKKRPVKGVQFTEEFVVDCEHGTTTVFAMNPPGAAVQISDYQTSAMAVAKHYDEEHCRCTRQLRKRFGL